ncbi:MAG: efflux RND transporter periplasmic adaptor subunit, partial [Planctomycetia bacterium]|nr:efflux RND transporter periplasmic adaptor subunit [Planctomycetia bacterium]
MMETERNEFLKNATRSWWVFGRHILISLGILVASIIIAVTVSQGRSPDEAQSIEEVIPAVKTETAILEENGVTFQVDGVVIPFREVAVASEVAGNITFLASNCRTGRYVKKGETLAKIDSRDYEHLLAEAEQNFIKAEREIEEWKVALVNNEERAKIAAEQFQTQERECERCKKLFQKGAVSQTELEAAVLNLLTKKEALVTLQNENRTLNAQKERLDANRESMRIAVEKAKLNLDRCTICAPLTGLVVTLSVEQDKFVQRGETLVSIHDTSRLEVQCSLYMKQVEWLWSEKKPENENVAEAENVTDNVTENGAEK